MDLGLAGRAVLIGGASRGIGLAIAGTFLAEGAKVCLTARDPAGLDAARLALSAVHGAERVVAVAGDMTLGPVIEAALDETERRFGPVYAVVANVGGGRPPGIDGAEGWARVLSLNLLSGALLAEAALRRLAPRKEGSITLIASIAGIERIQAPVPYAAAKAALVMATKHLAALGGRDGVRVNAVAPGNVLFPGGVWQRKLDEDAGAVSRYLDAEVPLGRLARPEEIADATAFLASPRSSFTTGATFVVDGGQTRSL